MSATACAAAVHLDTLDHQGGRLVAPTSLTPCAAAACAPCAAVARLDAAGGTLVRARFTPDAPAGARRASRWLAQWGDWRAACSFGSSPLAALDAAPEGRADG